MIDMEELELLKECVRERALHFTRRLHIDMSYLPVNNYGGKSLATNSRDTKNTGQIQLKTQGTSQFGIVIGDIDVIILEFGT